MSRKAPQLFMADVFISYSRKDKDFVRRLGDGLIAHDRAAWVDWIDIPLTAEWQQEILRNIEAADNFIFVISPDSVISPNCQKEIEHAAANNKKMLPLFYRPVPDTSVPEILNRFQRLEFDDPIHFAEKLNSLITALDTDLPWTQAHTRLLTRAKEWERMGVESSFLLRGKDLRDAEQWMARSSDRQPKPTTLQSQYILASRQAANRIQRIIIGAVAVAFLIAVSLAIYAFLQKNFAQRQTQLAQTNEAEAKKQRKAADDNAAEAIRQKNTAQENEAEAVRQKGIAQDETAKAILQANITNARRMATESLYRFGYNLEDLAISGALALESLQAYPTTEGMKALSQVLRLIPASPQVIPKAHHGIIESLAFSSDGHWMASGGGEVRLWDISDQMKPHALQPPQPVPLRAPIKTLAFTADGRWLAAGSDGAVCIWDIRTGKPIEVIRHGYVVRSLAFSPDGEYLATTTYGEGTGRGVRLFRKSPQQWEEVKPFPQGDGPSVSVYFLKDGALAVADRSGVWITHPGSSDNHDYKMTEAGPCFALSLSEDRSTLIALCEKGIAIAALKNEAYEFSTTFPVEAHNSSVSEFRISVSSTGDFIAVDDIIYAARSGTKNLLLTGSSCCGSVAFRPDGRAVAGGTRDAQESSISLWPTEQGNQSLRVRGAAEKVAGLSISPDETLLASVGETGAITLFDISRPDRIRQVKEGKVGPGLKSVAFGPDGRLLTVTAEDHVFFLEARTLKIVATYSLSGESAVALSVDGHTILVHDKDGIRSFDSETAQIKHSAISGIFDDFRLSLDGRYLAARREYSPHGMHHYIRTQRVWKLSNGVEVAWEETGREESDGPAERPPQGGPQSLIKESLAWPSSDKRSTSPDGILRIEFDRYSPTVTLEEADSKRPVASFEHDAKLTDAVFSPRGRWVASTSQDGSIRLWPLQVNDLAARACRMLPRNLTPEEWKTFGMAGPYRKVCADLP
jgi:WD40 repeat protein/type II secretory pathway component PulM